MTKNGNQTSPPGFLDSIIILLVSSALVIFLLWATSRVVGIDAFEHLPGWLSESYHAVWTSIAAGTAGIGLAIVKVLTRNPQERSPNYLLLIGITTVVMVIFIFVLPKAFKQRDDKKRLTEATPEIDSKPAKDALPTVKKANFDWRQHIQNGHQVFLLTNNLADEPNRCIGSIRPDTLYKITFKADEKGWEGRGDSGTDNDCHTLSQSNRFEDKYTCQNPEFKWLCEDQHTPAQGQVIVWGATFNFNDGGKATHNGNDVGVLLVNPPGK